MQNSNIFSMSITIINVLTYRIDRGYNTKFLTVVF